MSTWADSNTDPATDIFAAIREIDAQITVARRISIEMMLDQRATPISEEEHARWIKISEMRDPEIIESPYAPDRCLIVIDRAALPDQRSSSFLLTLNPLRDSER